MPDRHGRRRAVAADLFVCALPVERARQLWTPRILNADPRLEGMNRIQTVWANGIQFYLRREVAVVRAHYFCIDSPWGVSSISHAQFWDVVYGWPASITGAATTTTPTSLGCDAIALKAEILPRIRVQPAASLTGFLSAAASWRG